MTRRRVLTVVIAGTVAAATAVTGQPLAHAAADPKGSPGAGPLPVPPPIATPAGTLLPPADIPSAAVAADGEVPSLRTAMSRTFKAGTGYRVQIAATPVNYRDASGAWQKIDTSLRADGASYSPAASGTAVSIPTSLAAPVTVGSDASQVGFALQGASPTSLAATSGSTAAYANALPGVTVTEASTPAGVSEHFLLASATSTAEFIEQVSLPAGAALTQRGSGAAVVSSTGAVIGTISAPVTTDHDGATSTSATTLTVAGDDLVIAVDPAWLSAPDRAFPVDVDPDYNGSNGASEAQLESGSQAGVNYGTPATNCVGNDSAHANAVARSAFSFPDIGASLPRDAQILSAQLGLNVTSVGASTQIEAYDLTQPFAWYQASWNNASSGTPWTSAGGTYAPTGASPTTVSSTGGLGIYVNPAWVQGWLDNPKLPQDGFLLKATNESGAKEICFTASPNSGAPYLNVFYQQRIGKSSSEQYFSHSIDGHESVNVNLADGNLVDEANEFSDSSPGVPLSIDRTYNSLQATAPWMNGLGWFTTPSDSGTYCCGPVSSPSPTYDGTQLLSSGLDGSDTWDPYHPDYTGTAPNTFADPPVVDATLAKTSSGYTLTHHGSQTVETITDSTGDQLASITSRTGLSETVNHNSTAFGGTSDPDVTTVTDTVGRTYTYAYGSSGGYITGITGPTVNGAALTTGYTYQGGSSYNSTLPNGELLTATDIGGGVTHYGYDSSDRINKITSPKGNIVTLTYDGSNRVTSITYVTNTQNLTGDTYRFWYTAPTTTGGSGSTQVEGPLSGRTNPTTAPPAGTPHVTTYQWSSDDQITLVTDALGRHHADTYSLNGDGLTDTDGLSTGYGSGGGNTGTNTYDSNNNLMTSQGAPLQGASGQYAAGMTSNTYSPTGYAGTGGAYLAGTTTDAQKNMTSLGYDTMGLENKTTLPGSYGSMGTTSYQGDSGVSCGAKTGEPCTSTDADGHATTYSYDSQGNVTGVHPPAPLVATSSTPDALGRPVVTTDGDGNVTHYVYNGLGEITTTELAGTTTCTTSNISAGTCVQATYDQDGRQLTLVDKTGTVTYSYDLTGAQTGESEPGDYSSTIAYDADGNAVTFTDDGGAVGYTYDAADTLTDVQEPGGNCTDTSVTPNRPYATTDSIPSSAVCTAFAYDGNGDVTQLEYPGGSKMVYTRDNDGRVLTLVSTQPDGSTSKFSQTLAYQTAANPTADTSLIQTLADTDTGTHAFGYDALNRLTSDTTSSGTATWTYDAAGNRTQSKSASGTVTYYAYNPANELCETGTTQITTSYTGSCSAGSASGSNTRFTYDGNGNLLTGTLPGGVTTQSCNAANQTTQSVTGGTTNGYAYNGTSQTQRKWGNGDAYDSGLDAKDGQPSRVNDGSSKYDWITRTPDGTPIALRSGSGANSTNWYYTLDYQGSARRLSAANDYGPDGSYSYDDYGKTLTNTNDYPALTINPVNYTGGTTDASTGLTLHGARYANPATGTWTQQDSSGLDNSLYKYADDGPVNGVDPTGDFCVNVSIGPFSYSHCKNAGNTGNHNSFGVGPSFGLGLNFSGDGDDDDSPSKTSYSCSGAAIIGVYGNVDLKHGYKPDVDDQDTGESFGPYIGLGCDYNFGF